MLEDEASFWRFLEGAGPPTLFAWDDLPDAAAVQRALSLHLPGHSFLGAAGTERAAHLPDLHNHISCPEEELPAALLELLGGGWGEDEEEKGEAARPGGAELELALRAGGDGGRCAIRAGRRVLLWRFADGPQTAELLGVAGAFFGSLRAAPRLSVYKTPDAAHRVKPDKFQGHEILLAAHTDGQRGVRGVPRGHRPAARARGRQRGHGRRLRRRRRRRRASHCGAVRG